MTTIDFVEKCEMLGISPDAYDSAADKIFDAQSECSPGVMLPFERYGQILNAEELRAIIAWEGLDGRFPDIFTSEGMQPQYQ